MTTLAKRILVCYDGSEGSKKAIKFASQFAQLDEQTEVDLVTIIRVQLPYEFYAGSLLLDQKSLLSEYEQKANESHDAVKEEWTLANPIHSYVIEGNPVEELLAFAKEHQNDLIIIGNRSLGTFKELLLGSVSHHVVQHAHCPVLVAK